MYVYFVIVMTFVVIVSVIRRAVTRSKGWESFYPTLMCRWFLCWLMMLDDVNRKEEWLDPEQWARLPRFPTYPTYRIGKSFPNLPGTGYISCRKGTGWMSFWFRWRFTWMLSRCWRRFLEWVVYDALYDSKQLHSNPTPMCWCQVEFGKSVFAQTPQGLQLLCQEHEKESWNGGLWLLAML